jgi:hypothetical protein
VDPNVRELALVSGIACASLGLAWFYEADYFAIFFAGAAAIAIFEAVRQDKYLRLPTQRRPEHQPNPTN